MPRRKKSRLQSRLEPFLLNLGLGFFSSTLGRLSWPAAQRVGRRIGSLAWSLSRRDRRRALDHIALAYPELSEAERQQLGQACFRHHGTTLGECLHLLHRDCEFVRSVVDVQGWEEVEKARAADRPVLILTGHCGNWELLAAAINCRGLGMAVVARRLEERLCASGGGWLRGPCGAMASVAPKGPRHCAPGVGDGQPAWPGRSGRSVRESSPTARTSVTAMSPSLVVSYSASPSE